MPNLKVGDKAPAFTLLDQNGEARTLKEIGGSYTVLFFYPKDNTPGCTVESIDFSRQLAKFTRLGVTVVGISGGDVKSKQKFCSAHDLKMTLLADTDFAVAKKFGAYGEKKFMGRTFNGIFRKTFVLDKAGNVAQVYDSVKPDGHAGEVLVFIQGAPTEKVAKSPRTSERTAGRATRKKAPAKVAVKRKR